MKRVQRRLIKPVRMADELPAGVSTWTIPGTGLVVPVVGRPSLPASCAIGVPRDLCGLTVADLQQPRVAELLAREGLGVVVTLSWDAGSHHGVVVVHARSFPVAIRSLAEGVRRTGLRPKPGDPSATEPLTMLLGRPTAGRPRTFEWFERDEDRGDLGLRVHAMPARLPAALEELRGVAPEVAFRVAAAGRTIAAMRSPEGAFSVRGVLFWLYAHDFGPRADG